MKKSILESKTSGFAIEIMHLSTDLIEKREYNIGNQIFRSGTSIGANVAEAHYAQSKADFISKLSIALKEANETKFWLELLINSGRISELEYKQLNLECTEIRLMLI